MSFSDAVPIQDAPSFESDTACLPASSDVELTDACMHVGFSSV